MRSGDGLSSVLVAVGGHGTDEEAVRLAGDMLRGNKRGRLHILYVIEVERTLPVDAEIPMATARGDAVLRRMEELATSMKIGSQAELLQSRQIGYAVVQEAVDKEVDAIVMAVPYGNEYGRFTMGRTVPYVFEHAPCRVILWRDNSGLGLDAGPRAWGAAVEG